MVQLALTAELTGVICSPALVLFKIVFRIGYSVLAAGGQACRPQAAGTRARRNGKLAGTPARAK
jgi:hypothetical protein